MLTRVSLLRRIGRRLRYKGRTTVSVIIKYNIQQYILGRHMYINRLTPERVKPWDICIARAV